MSNLCRNKNPAPPFDRVKIMLPVLAQLLMNTDIPILSKQIFIAYFEEFWPSSIMKRFFIFIVFIFSSSVDANI